MTTLSDIKTAIWAKCKRCPITVQVAADKAGVRLPITQVHEAQKLWDSLNKKKLKRKVETPRWCIDRYEQAHKDWFRQQFPECWKDGHYAGMEPDFPDLGTGNGINKFIENYLAWKGHRATRINVTGRMLNDGTRIKSTTRTGAADISSTINGKSCQWEGKAGSDKPRPEQLREQALERKAGGSYEFIHNAEEFFGYYDKLLLVMPTQQTIFE